MIVWHDACNADIPLDLINPSDTTRDVIDDSLDITGGIRESIRVERMGERFRVVEGNRRLAAARKAGMATVPCQMID